MAQPSLLLGWLFNFHTQQTLGGRVIEIQDRLVFDSWNSAVPDLRGSSGDERHLIYEGAGIVLDLLLKPATEGSCLQIGGQVLPTDDLSQSVAHVAVLLENGGAS